MAWYLIALTSTALALLVICWAYRYRGREIDRLNGLLVKTADQAIENAKVANANAKAADSWREEYIKAGKLAIEIYEKTQEPTPEEMAEVYRSLGVTKEST